MQLSPQQIVTLINRRSFLSRTSLGLGATALASLANPDWLSAASEPKAVGALPGLPHLAAKSKRVIFLCMAGGPSHLETFDYKPELARLDGQPMPESFTKGQPIAQLQNTKLKCLGPLFPFRRHGQSGQQISDMLPGIAGIADDIAIVRSMHTDQINHDPAHTVMNTGTSISGRPSMGAWVTYGLGSPNEDLPGFVVLTSEGGRNPQPISSRQWGAGFLPSRHQGVQFFSQGDPVHYVRSAPGVNREQQRGFVEMLGKLNRLRNERVANPEIDTRIAQYELAFRMQASVPELMDLSGEPQHVLDAYGVKGMDGSFAANCLLARRLAERGTRFIHLYHRGWDHHGDLERYMKICCGLCDHPSAALVKDLKARGMLDDTLVIWMGEFGRTPGDGNGHFSKAWSTMWAGGGLKTGQVIGKTSDGKNPGSEVAERPVTSPDFLATLCLALGMDIHKEFMAPGNRPMPMVDKVAKPITEMLG